MTALDLSNRIMEISMILLKLSEKLTDGTISPFERDKFNRLTDEKTKLAHTLKGILVDESDTSRPKMHLSLWPESWENMFDCLHHKDTRIYSQGNFWAAVQAIEEQSAYHTPERRKALGILEQEEVS